MNRNSMKRLLRCLLFAFVLVLPMFVSCGVTEETSKYDVTQFLFIPIDGRMTFGTSTAMLVLQVVAIGLNVFYFVKPGWRHHEIRRNIYDKDGREVGSYDTGEYDSWYVSEKEAEKKTDNVHFWSHIARIVLPRIYITGCVVSWIFQKHLGWTIFFTIIIAGIWLYFRFSKGHIEELNKKGEIIYMVFLLACAIVFGIATR